VSFRTVTGTWSVSSNDRMRGRVGRSTIGSRTRVICWDEPKRSTSIATAMMRSAPWNSGTLKVTLALPSASATTGPDQNATGSTRRMPSVRTYWAMPSAPSPPPAGAALTSGSIRLKVS
jgi:hypothetical protein